MDPESNHIKVQTQLSTSRFKELRELQELYGMSQAELIRGILLGNIQPLRKYVE